MGPYLLIGIKWGFVSNTYKTHPNRQIRPTATVSMSLPNMVIFSLSNMVCVIASYIFLLHHLMRASGPEFVNDV